MKIKEKMRGDKDEAGGQINLPRKRLCFEMTVHPLDQKSSLNHFSMATLHDPHDFLELRISLGCSGFRVSCPCLGAPFAKTS